jgi:hypothetical protein
MARWLYREVCGENVLGIDPEISFHDLSKVLLVQSTWQILMHSVYLRFTGGCMVPNVANSSPSSSSSLACPRLLQSQCWQLSVSWWPVIFTLVSTGPATEPTGYTWGLMESTHSVGTSPSFDPKAETDSVCETLCLVWSTREWTKSRNSEIICLIHVPPSEPFSITYEAGRYKPFRKLQWLKAQLAKTLKHIPFCIRCKCQNIIPKSTP